MRRDWDLIELLFATVIVLALVALVLTMLICVGAAAALLVEAVS